MERFWSSCARTARHAWAVLAYVLRNATAAGCRPRAGQLDRYAGVEDATIEEVRFLRALLGPDHAQRQALTARMARDLVPFVPLAERLQPRLPGS